LIEARSELERADHLNPADWAVQCDLGSTWMRLGYWRKTATDFSLARAHLTRVISDLRPDYGFALYEIGRIWRLQGNFDQATTFFDKAFAVPAEYRDVSNRRVGLEKNRAIGRDSSYP